MVSKITNKSLGYLAASVAVMYGSLELFKSGEREAAEAHRIRAPYSDLIKESSQCNRTISYFNGIDTNWLNTEALTRLQTAKERFNEINSNKEYNHQIGRSITLENDSGFKSLFSGIGSGLGLVLGWMSVAPAIYNRRRRGDSKVQPAS